MNLYAHKKNTSFEEEVNKLKQEKHVKLLSSILPLSPFTYRAGLLYAGGRLKSANLPPNSKHQ